MLEGPRDPNDPFIGRVVGDRYKVTELLGHGGMGRVYAAEQKMGTVTRRVALKTLHPDLAADPAVARRFNREAETVIQLSHPNTITFYDFGQTEEGTFYIVMELIEGESLATALEAGPMPPERVEHILAQICSSLHEAHERGVIHRDLKPENIILVQRPSQRDFVKVLDFGIAKRTELDADSLKLTKAGIVIGTPPYMSPEQFAGHPLDRRTDIYSLGVMTYEMLTGQRPFAADTAWEWATQHMSADPAPMEATPAGKLLPESCRRAVRRALSKHPGDRQETAMELLDELSGRKAPPAPSAATLTAPARVVGTPSVVEPSFVEEEDEELALPRRSSLPLLFGAGIAALAVGAAVAAVVHLRGPDDPTRRDGSASTLLARDAGRPLDAPVPTKDGTPARDGAHDAAGGGTEPRPGSDAGDGTPSREEDAGRPRPRVDPAAAAALQQVRAALRRDDLARALELLPGAEQLAGRRTAAARALRQQVAARVSNRVGLALMQGSCGRAQALYRQARRAGAHRGARAHFNADWCPAPE